MKLTAIPERVLHSQIFLLVCLTGIGILSASFHPLDSDEGMILTGAWNLLNGRNLYEQTFEYVAPGSFYLITWVWQLLGSASYEGARVAALAAAAGTSLAIFHTARLLAGPQVTVLPALTFFIALVSGPVINHNAIFTLPAAWSLFFAVRSVLLGSYRDGIFSGLLCGCAILVLQHKGIVLAASLALTIPAAKFREDKKKAIQLGAALILATLLPLLVLFTWDIEVIFGNLFLFPLEHYMGVQQGNFFAWLAVVPLWFWIYWRILALCPGPALMLLGLGQTVLLLTVFQRPDIYHFITVSFPTAVIFPLFIRTYSFPSPPTASAVARLGDLVGAGISISLFIFAFTLFPESAVYERVSSNSRVALVGAVEKHCSDSSYIYAGSFIPGVYFETRKMNPSRHSILLERFNTTDQFLQTRRQLERARPGCVVIDNRLGSRFGHTGRNPVEEWVAREYDVVERVGTAKIMRPASGPQVVR